MYTHIAYIYIHRPAVILCGCISFTYDLQTINWVQSVKNFKKNIFFKKITSNFKSDLKFFYATYNDQLDIIGSANLHSV